MKLGIVGLPNVGKSTLFNAITKAGAECANYPFCTIEPNVGMVTVPDKRLEVLTKMYDADKTTYATIEFVDIAGLVKGASQGEGLGNKFLSHIRETDSIVHIVRCFESESIVHVSGKVDPIEDIETINLELVLSDTETVKNKLDRITKMVKVGDKKAIFEQELLSRIMDTLKNLKPVRSINFTEEEEIAIKDLCLLTKKPIIYVANVSEDDAASGIKNEYVKKVEEYANAENAKVIVLSAKLEEELSSLQDDEKEMMMEEYSLKESGLDKLVRASYSLLGLISFLTAGKQEVRAWTITKRTKAPQAAGKIHTDFERGFIKAEIVSYDALIENGSIAKAREKGLVRLEGKEYVMQDGDVTVFRFNV